MGEHLLLVDASGFAHRAYHRGSAHRFRSDGLPTWAIEGFLGMMWRMLGAAQYDQPTLAAAVFDAPGKTFRHELHPEYKYNRPARDQELVVQMPWLRHAAEAMGITPVEMVGFEADDVIATLATQAAGHGIRTTIVSSDKDFAQLVQNGLVEVLDPVSRVRYREDDVRGLKFGVPPSLVPDYQALAGDSVDNIPGIDGIGPVSAGAMVRIFGAVEAVVAAVRTDSHFFTPGQRVRLKEPGVVERLQLYRQLATLRRDVPLQVQVTDLVLQPILREHIDKILAKLEATGRFEAIFATAPQMQRVVEPLGAEDQIRWWATELRTPGQAITDLPQCGYYERRLVRGAAPVAAVIWREDEQDPITGEVTGQQILRCQVGDAPKDPVQEWGALCRRPITKERYEYRIAVANWAKEHAPDEPEANPSVPIDWNRIAL